MVTHTTEEAEKRQNEIFARLSGEQKVLMAMELSDNLRDIAWAEFCRRHFSVSEKVRRLIFLMELHGIDLRRWSEGQADE